MFEKNQEAFMYEKDPYCSPDINPASPAGCLTPKNLPEDVKEAIIAEKSDLEDVDMENEPLGEEDDKT